MHALEGALANAASCDLRSVAALAEAREPSGMVGRRQATAV